LVRGSRVTIIAVAAVITVTVIAVPVAVITVAISVMIPVAALLAIPLLVATLIATALVVATLVIAALLGGVLLKLLLAGLLFGGLLAHRFGQHAGIMLGVLLEILSRNAIIAQLSIAEKLLIFLYYLLWRTTHLTFGAGAVEGAVDDIAEGARAVLAGTRAFLGRAHLVL